MSARAEALALQRALRVERRAARLQCKQLALKIGSNAQHISALERGLHLGRLDVLCKWARALGLEVVFRPVGKGSE